MQMVCPILPVEGNIQCWPTQERGRVHLTLQKSPVNMATYIQKMVAIFTVVLLQGTILKSPLRTNNIRLNYICLCSSLLTLLINLPSIVVFLMESLVASVVVATFFTLPWFFFQQTTFSGTKILVVTARKVILDPRPDRIRRFTHNIVVMINI